MSNATPCPRVFSVTIQTRQNCVLKTPHQARLFTLQKRRTGFPILRCLRRL
jgi:hypothetical protein